MAKTKTIIQYAIDNGKLTINPFQSINIKREKNPIEFLTEEELNRIATQEYSTEALKRVADVFLVQAYSGLSFVDLEGLRKEDISEIDGVYYISKKRHKTKVEYTAVLFPKAIDILKKYDYHLPIISNQKTNRALKAVAREAGVDKIYKVGGAQAIAALAFGTESIPKVDKIVGPGNIYVALAKKAVYG